MLLFTLKNLAYLKYQIYAKDQTKSQLDKPDPPVHLITYLFTNPDLKQQDFKDLLHTKVSRFGMQSLQISKLKVQGYFKLNLRYIFWITTTNDSVSPRFVTSRRSDFLN